MDTDYKHLLIKPYHFLLLSAVGFSPFFCSVRVHECRWFECFIFIKVKKDMIVGRLPVFLEFQVYIFQISNRIY